MNSEIQSICLRCSLVSLYSAAAIVILCIFVAVFSFPWTIECDKNTIGFSYSFFLHVF